MKHPAFPVVARASDAAVTRRRFLRGVGACLTLPLFETALRASPVAAAGGSAPGLTPGGAPLRMAFVYFPNGAHQDNWWPTGEGAGFQLGRTMEPLSALKGSIQVLGGLDHKNATAGNDGAGAGRCGVSAEQQLRPTGGPWGSAGAPQ